MNEVPSPEEVNAASESALALERARGVEIPKDNGSKATYKIGFSDGALWVIAMLRAAQ